MNEFMLLWAHSNKFPVLLLFVNPVERRQEPFLACIKFIIYKLLIKN